MQRAKEERRNYFLFKHRLSSGEVRNVEVFSGPVHSRKKKLLCSIIHDISDRIRAEREREAIILDLQGALKEIKTLRGIIPICAQCKSIRNDEGAWDALEKYMAERSEVEFSHSICPDCARKIYRDLDI